MDKVVLLPSIVLALIAVGLYLFQCHSGKKIFDHSVMITTVLNSSGVICGCVLIVGSINDDVMKYISQINLYIFIGGLAVLAVSIQGLYNSIISPNNGTEYEMQDQRASKASNEAVNSVQSSRYV
ncbi:MAG: threonyl-tRNA synthetase [Chlorobaculum sp.]|jgi:hypothetical protein|nr:threonyl-tRNA synthetase [Chlorobaculum sp.]